MTYHNCPYNIKIHENLRNETKIIIVFKNINNNKALKFLENKICLLSLNVYLQNFKDFTIYRATSSNCPSEKNKHQDVELLSFYKLFSIMNFHNHQASYNSCFTLKIITNYYITLKKFLISKVLYVGMSYPTSIN